MFSGRRNIDLGGWLTFGMAESSNGQSNFVLIGKDQSIYGTYLQHTQKFPVSVLRSKPVLTLLKF